MWIQLKDSFISIVEDQNNPTQLLVRARVAGDIERIFRHAKVVKGAGTDYEYRAFIDLHEAASAIYREVLAIDYPNFKAAVEEPFRHDAYMQVWTTLMGAFRGK